MSLNPAFSGDEENEKDRVDFFRTLGSLLKVDPARSGDIEKLMLYEGTLWESRRFLIDVFDSFQEGINITDKDLNIVQTNRVLEEIFQDSMPIVGKRCHQVFAGRDEPCEGCPSIKAMKDKAPHSAIMHLFEGMPGDNWVRITAFPLLDAEGNVRGVIEHSRNISENKKAEKALSDAKLQAELYLDLMGHDINNINQIGMGYLELALSSTRLDETSRSLISRSMMAFENSSRLIDNVRKLQRIRSGELSLKEMDAGHVLADVCRHYVSLHSESVTINYAKVDGATVMANELLFDLFSNLVGNAIKHSNGFPVVNIGLETEIRRADKYYRVSIEDNGPGIPDEMKTLIFNRQLRGGPKSKGSGMGLYLVKALADAFHGQVWAEDRVSGDRSNGSRFVVRLPAAKN